VCIALPGFAANDKLLIADFNAHPAVIGEPAYTNLGNQYGVWNVNPDDPTQGCSLTFSTDDAFAQGSSVQLTYDVDSPNPACNGFWMKLGGADFTPYSMVNFYLKGDRNAGFTRRLKIELKDSEVTAAYVIDGITDEWQKFSVPFTKFLRIQDWGSMREFVVVFDDLTTRPKRGALFLDEVSVSFTPAVTQTIEQTTVEPKREKALRRLAELLTQGFISEQEFLAAQKTVERNCAYEKTHTSR